MINDGLDLRSVTDLYAYAAQWDRLGARKVLKVHVVLDKYLQMQETSSSIALLA